MNRLADIHAIRAMRVRRRERTFVASRLFRRAFSRRSRQR